MNPITKHIRVPIPIDRAFRAFVYELNEWWPKEYTWSQEQLERITIDAKKDGLCTEIGPYHFRCDWGRVVEMTDNEKIALIWQISPRRVPEPNPDKASKISVHFGRISETATTLTFEHTHFENHGDGAEDYRNAMNSEQGWDYILTCYTSYCEQLQG